MILLGDHNPEHNEDGNKIRKMIVHQLSSQFYPITDEILPIGAGAAETPHLQTPHVRHVM